MSEFVCKECGDKMAEHECLSIGVSGFKKCVMCGKEVNTCLGFDSTGSIIKDPGYYIFRDGTVEKEKL